MRWLAVCSLALVFGFFGSIPLVGPIAIMVLSRAARRRFDEARRIGLGAALAEGIYAGIAFWGFATFLAKHGGVMPISYGTSAVLFLALGARFVFWRPEERTDQRASKAGTALLGFSVSALNPTLLLTWSGAIAFLYSKGLDREPALVAVPFGASAAAGVGGWMVCFVALLQKLEGRLPRAAMTWTVRIMGLVLVGLGTWSGVQLTTWIEERVERSGRSFERSTRPTAPLTSPSWQADRRT